MKLLNEINGHHWGPPGGTGTFQLHHHFQTDDIITRYQGVSLTGE